MRPESFSHLSNRPHGKWEAGKILLDSSLAEGPISLSEIFGNTGPVEIEIGTGKGTFLRARAAARPELNFLGIEWAKAYTVYAADRFRRADLTNVRMIHTDAGPFVKNCLSANSIWRFHIYFPDPWPKTRHHRRRLIQPAFVELARQKLLLGGQIIIVTDHQDYFQHIQKVMSAAKGLVPIPMPRMADKEGEIVGTNFERKYIAQGRPFYSLCRMRYL